MEELNFKRKLFGGEIEFIVYTSKEDSIKDYVEEIIEEAYKEALRLQNIFNFFESESEISLLNKKRKLKASKELIEVLKIALEFSVLTKGKYDVTLGKVILQRKKGENEVKPKSSYKDVEIRGNEITLKHEDAMIDLGSIAKGYITDKLADFLKNKGIYEFLINSKGDLVISGDYNHAVNVQHPRDESKILFTLNLKNQAVATSGDYYQFYGGFEKSHIINQKEFISITIVAPTLALADVYATALFVADEEERKKIINLNKKIGILLVDKELNTYMFNNFLSLIEKSK